MARIGVKRFIIEIETEEGWITVDPENVVGFTENIESDEFTVDVDFPHFDVSFTLEFDGHAFDKFIDELYWPFLPFTPFSRS